MKNIIDYITEGKESFDSAARQCLGNNADVISHFKKLISYCFDSEEADRFSSRSEAEKETNFCDDLASIAEENDTYFNWFYAVRDNCKIQGETAKDEAINGLVWLYLKENK